MSGCRDDRQTQIRLFAAADTQRIDAGAQLGTGCRRRGANRRCELGVWVQELGDAIEGGLKEERHSWFNELGREALTSAS